jgi:hypothetical protein
MKIIEYRSEDYERLRPVVERTGPGVAFCHPPFINHFYTTRDSSRLLLATKNDGSVAGTLGLEALRFEHRGRELNIGFGTNFFSFAFGTGGLLYQRWMKTFTLALIFGGSEDSHRICREQEWTYYSGMRVFLLNRAYPPRAGEPLWRRAARWAAERARPRLAHFTRRIQRAAPPGLTVREEQTYADDLLPRSSPFTFRFAPPVDYLAWRYDTRLSYVRYRLFRVLRGAATAGFVILNDQPHRLVVAHCDGEDPAELAHGIALSIAAAAQHDRRPREVMLTNCHPAMQTVFHELGFRSAGSERPFVLGSLGHRDLLPPADTSEWLINFDFGDNGLRPPFLDQQTE